MSTFYFIFQFSLIVFYLRKATSVLKLGEKSTTVLSTQSLGSIIMEVLQCGN